SLLASLSIDENIFLNAFPRHFGGYLIDREKLAERTRDLLRQVNLDLPPETPLDRLSPGERQLVEVARALQSNAEIIIFDEPTTSLTKRETDRLFELIGSLRTAGKSMIYISHILADVTALADDITVLRDGAVVATAGRRGDCDIPRRTTPVAGGPTAPLCPPRQSRPQAEVLLSATGVGAPGVLHDVGFELHRGEVLGVFGLMGSGRTELARVLF